MKAYVIKTESGEYDDNDGGCGKLNEAKCYPTRSSALSEAIPGENETVVVVEIKEQP